MLRVRGGFLRLTVLLLILSVAPCSAREDGKAPVPELNEKQKQNVARIARIAHIDERDKRFLQSYISKQFALDVRKVLQPNAKIESIPANETQKEVAAVLLHCRWPDDHRKLDRLTDDWTFEKTIRNVMPFLMVRQEKKHDGKFWSAAIAYRLMVLGRRLQPLIHHLLADDDPLFQHIGIKLAYLYAWRTKETPAFGMAADALLILDIIRNSEDEKLIFDGFATLNQYDYATAEAITLAKKLLRERKQTDTLIVSRYIEDSWSMDAQHTAQELAQLIRADTPPDKVLEYLESSNGEYLPETVEHIANLVRENAPGQPDAKLKKWQLGDPLKHIYWSGRMNQYLDLFDLFLPKYPMEAIAWYYASKDSNDPKDIPKLIQAYSHIDENGFREHSDYAKAIIHLSAFAENRNWSDLKALTCKGKKVSRLWASYAYWRITKDKGPFETAISDINWEDRQSSGAAYISDVLEHHPDEAFRYVRKISRMSGPFQQGLTGPYLQLLYRLTGNSRQVCAKLNTYLAEAEDSSLGIDGLWETMQLLGPRAAPCVPGLARILEKARPGYYYRARHTCEILSAIGLHPDTKALAPRVLKMLGNPEAGYVHRPACLTLYMLTGDPAPAVDVLLRQAEMGGWMRVWNIRFLKMMGPDARAALPRLKLWAAHSASGKVREEASRAIQAIETPKAIDEEQLNEYWKRLADTESYLLPIAIRKIIQAGAPARAFISERIAKDESGKLDERAIAALIQKLADERFNVREDATMQLLKTVDYSELFLRAALKKTKDPEVRMRLKWLLSPEKTSERTIPTKPANFNPQHRRQQDRARMILRAIDALLNKKDAKQGEGL